MTWRARTSLAVSLSFASVLGADFSRCPAPTAVKHREGLVHGFLALRTLEGELLAAGDLIQTARPDRVTSRLVFSFKDGSSHDETAVFSQDRHFRLLSYRLVQKGPAFEHPMEVKLDGKSGQVTVRHTDEDGGRRWRTNASRPPRIWPTASCPSC